MQRTWAVSMPHDTSPQVVECLFYGASLVTHAQVGAGLPAGPFDRGITVDQALHYHITSCMDRSRSSLDIIAPGTVEDLIVAPAPDLPEPWGQGSARQMDEGLVAHHDALASLAERDGHDHHVSGLERTPAAGARSEHGVVHVGGHPRAAPLRRSRHLRYRGRPR